MSSPSVERPTGPPSWTAESETAAVGRRLPRYLLPVVALVILLHAGLLVPLLVQTKQNTIILANTEPPASVRVTMVQPPPPPPLEAPSPPPEPRVLTSENAERSVAQAEQPPTPPDPVKPEPVLKPKPKPKPPQPTPQLAAEPRPEPTPAEPEPAGIPGPVASQSAGEKFMELPSSGPKDVQTVGCRVPAPDYPRRALRQRTEGVVVVQLVINEQGRVEDTGVIRSSGNASLDEAALKAVSGASCSPYIENGRAIAVRASQPVSFRLSR